MEWSRIMDGEPIESGRLVYGLGVVSVPQSQEQRAEAVGGNPMVEIFPVTPLRATTPHWQIGTMIPRDPALTEQWKRERMRYQLLKWYFDNHYSNPYSGKFCDDFAAEFTANLNHAELAWDYISNQGLLENIRGARGATISHQGILEVERRLSGDNSSNLLGIHMNQTNNFKDGSFGSVQIGGTGNSTSVSQSIGVSGDELANLASVLRQEVARLPVEQRAGAEEVVEGLLEEAKKDTPKLSVVNALIAALPAMIQALPALADFAHKL